MKQLTIFSGGFLCTREMTSAPEKLEGWEIEVVFRP
jgi:hypothetical protein